MGLNIAAQNQQISDHVQRFGWHCLHVFPTGEGGDHFTYSIGFGESYDAPEVLVFGVERDKAHALLSQCAQMLREGHTIVAEAEDSAILSNDYKVIYKAVLPEHYGEYLGTAMRYYGEREFSAVVMFLPDRQHRFPWQPGYDGMQADEPLSIVQHSFERVPPRGLS